MASSFIKIAFMAACLSFSLSSTTSFAKEYYKWVDAKGSTHYTTTPPPKSAKKKGKVETYGTTHSASPATQENNAAKEAKNTVQENKPVNPTIPVIPEGSIPATPKVQ